MTLPGVPAYRSGGTTPAVVGAGIDLLLAGALGVLRTANASAGQHHAEGRLPTAALVIALAAPGVLALIGIATARPLLFGAAGFACGPFLVLSIAALPFALPAVLFFIAFVRAETSRRRPSLLAGLVLAAFPAATLTGLGILITRTASSTYTFANGSETGDHFTRSGAWLCIAIVGAGFTLATVLARLTPAPAPSQDGPGVNAVISSPLHRA